MASTLRLGTSALRSSTLAGKPVVQSAVLNGLRCYSTGKTKVRLHTALFFLAN
jgi:citrate synthase